jgi:exopolysaccharide production protein ExoZ
MAAPQTDADNAKALSRQVHRGGLQSVQYLRGAAALMVVFYHIRPRLLRMGWDGAWPDWLSCGVDIFFVISGLIMWVTTCDRDMGPGEFMRRRFLRIVPLYYVVTALIIVLMVVAPALVIGGRIDLAHIAGSFAFFPVTHPVLGTLEPVLPQGWTLNYEMEFYLFFALGLLLPRRIRAWALPLWLVALVVIGLRADPKSAFGFFTSSLILEFGFGILLGVALASGVRLGRVISALVFVAGVAGLVLTWPIVTGGVPRAALSGVCAAMIVGGAVFLEARGAIWRNGVLRLLGDASYSIYLTHGLALSAIGFLWTRTGLAAHPASLVAFVPLAAIAATLAGIAVHLWVERPLLAMFGSFGRERRPQPA